MLDGGKVNKKISNGHRHASRDSASVTFIWDDRGCVNVSPVIETKAKNVEGSLRKKHNIYFAYYTVGFFIRFITETVFPWRSYHHLFQIDVEN